MEDNERNEYDPFNTDDNVKDYGLPEVNFEPVQREEVPSPAPIPVRSQVKKEPEPKKNNNVGILIGALVLLLIFGGAGAYYYFNYYNQEPVSEYVPYEPEIVEKVVVEEPVDNTPAYVEPVPEENKVGSVSLVEGRTGRSYIIINSFFDEDNASDYSNTLIDKGVDAKLIRSRRYFKFSVADYESYGEAADQIENYKQNYGDQIWVLKY